MSFPQPAQVTGTRSAEPERGRAHRSGVEHGRTEEACRITLAYLQALPSSSNTSPKRAGNVMLTPDHHHAKIAFRVLNATGFEIMNVSRKSEEVRTDLLDELAKLIVSQPSSFA